MVRMIGMWGDNQVTIVTCQQLINTMVSLSIFFLINCFLSSNMLQIIFIYLLDVTVFGEKDFFNFYIFFQILHES